MERKIFPARTQERHAEIGFGYGADISADGSPYWTEGVAYEFSLDEIESLETATEDLHHMCMAHVENVISTGDFPDEYGFSDLQKEVIERSWSAGDPHLYGRFDLVATGDEIKLYEYNADTPTALLEAAVAQWDWLETVAVPNPDQFNSIHEKLVERWKEVVPANAVVHFFATREGPNEDWGNVQYVGETAYQGGFEIYVDEIENVGSDGEGFVNGDGDVIDFAFKLYPWEWMFEEPFASHLLSGKTRWIEPPWKLLLSHKALLPLLWDRHTGHPNLLATYFEEVDGFVKKPVLGREGANVHRRGVLMEGSVAVAEYDTQYIYQEYRPLPELDGWHPVIGSWVIGDEPAGIGIREDRTLISGNGSHFVPHYFV